MRPWEEQPGLILAEAGDAANGLHRRHAAHHADHCAEHANIGTAVTIFGIVRIADKAAIAGHSLFPATECSQLPMKLPNGGGHQGDTGMMGGVCHGKAGRKIV